MNFTTINLCNSKDEAAISVRLLGSRLRSSDPSLFRHGQQPGEAPLQRGVEEAAAALRGSSFVTHNLPTNIVDFTGLDSSIIFIQRGGMPSPIGKFPESLSQAMLVGCNVRREIGRIWVVSMFLSRSVVLFVDRLFVVCFALRRSSGEAAEPARRGRSRQRTDYRNHNIDLVCYVLCLLLC